MNNMDAERIKGLQQDVDDDRASVDEAKGQLREAKSWLAKMELNYAQSIIRLHEAQKDV